MCLSTIKMMLNIQNFHVDVNACIDLVFSYALSSNWKKKINDFLFSFTVSISSKLRTKHPWFKGFMFYQMKGQTFQWGIILTKTLFGQRGSVMGYGQFDMEINRQQMTVISQVKKEAISTFGIFLSLSMS